MQNDFLYINDFFFRFWFFSDHIYLEHYFVEKKTNDVLFTCFRSTNNFLLRLNQRVSSKQYCKYGKMLLSFY